MTGLTEPCPGAKPREFSNLNDEELADEGRYLGAAYCRTRPGSEEEAVLRERWKAVTDEKARRRMNREA